MYLLFSTIGKQLSTRMDGTAMREKIARGIEQNQWIVLDFDGVEVVSNSFADEKVEVHRGIYVMLRPYIYQESTCL